MQLKHRLGAMTDVRVLQGISLVLLELLTVVPAVTFTDILGEFIPFSIGSLAVLGQPCWFIILSYNELTYLTSIQLHLTTAIPKQ
jgi:hypothetical protein